MSVLNASEYPEKNQLYVNQFPPFLKITINFFIAKFVGLKNSIVKFHYIANLVI